MSRLILALLLAILTVPANAQQRGVAMQVNEGGPIPTVDQLLTVLGPGDYVRDVLGWNQVDRNCNLATDPTATIVIPDTMNALYANVAAAGGRNFVTLGFNNIACGQPSSLPSVAFPDTDALRAEFAAYAVAVVQTVPALGGISIWNEMNGSATGGYGTLAQRLAGYCALVNVVVPAIRQVNPTVPIAIGASMGWNIDGWFIHMFDRYQCVGKGDKTIWLDVHPYLTGKVNRAGKTDWQLWAAKIARIRAHGVSNPLVATEWGAGAAVKWTAQNPGGSYPQTFDAMVGTANGDWAALMWFEMLSDTTFPQAGLFDQTGASLTPLGLLYVAAYKQGAGSGTSSAHP